MIEFNEWQIHDGSEELPVPEGTMGQAMYGNECPDDMPVGVAFQFIKGAYWGDVFAYRTVKEPVLLTQQIMHPTPPYAGVPEWVKVSFFSDGTVETDLGPLKE